MADTWSAPTARTDGATLSIEQIARIARDVAAADAADVDARARFPEATMRALREVGALGAAVPRALGGAGAGLAELASACTTLGQACASSAMILAMHHIQVLCLARHGASRPEFADYLRHVAAEQRLIASVTSEVGVGGDLRRSIAHVSRDGDQLALSKHASTVSYGQHADDLLITARRAPEASAGDQVLVLALRGQHAQTDLGSWNTLGMRGTCSPSARITARVAPWQVVSDSFADVAVQTMVPTSHVLWAACWHGIALDAVAHARRAVRGRTAPGPNALPAGAQALSELALHTQTLGDTLRGAILEYERISEAGEPSALGSVGFALRINNLKLSMSRGVVRVASDALAIVGIGGYRNDAPESLGRHLRDAHSAPLMINNLRIEDTNAALGLLHRPEAQ